MISLCKYLNSFLIVVFLFTGCLRGLPNSSLDPNTSFGSFLYLRNILFPSLSSKDFTAFIFSSTSSSGVIIPADGKDGGGIVNVNVPYNTDVTSLTAAFTHTGRTVSIGNQNQNSGSTVNDFTKQTDYFIAAQDLSVKKYTVSVNIGTSSSNEITDFRLRTPSVQGLIAGTNITVYVPFGTSVSSLIPVFSHTGASVTVNGITQISETSANDFTNPVVYSVLAADGTKKNYTVTVNISEKTANDVTSFSIASPAVSAAVTGSIITLIFPPNANLKYLTASFVFSGSSVTVNGVPQISGRTVNNFNETLYYKVTAADGSSKTYAVFSSVSGTGDKDFNSFSLNYPVSAAGTIDKKAGTVVFSLTQGAYVGASAPVFSFSGANVSMNGVLQTSGVSRNNFSSPVIYKITAGDGTVKNYTVYINNFSNFKDNGDNTVTDSRTGLVWMKCSQGQNHDSSCSGAVTTFRFCSANDNSCNGGTAGGSLTHPSLWTGGQTSDIWTECNNLNSTPSGGFAGRNNWRVPTWAELISIMDISVVSPSINSAFFPNTPTGAPARWWTSNSYLGNALAAWFVSFDSGGSDTNDKITLYKLRCVSD